jgi:hypothetical protein
MTRLKTQPAGSDRRKVVRTLSRAEERLQWNDPTKVPVKGIEEDVFLHLCEAADSPRSLACWLLFKNREYRQLVELTIEHGLYDDVAKFELDYLCTSFFSKFQDFDLGFDREERAFTKWLAAEESCRLTNEKFRGLWGGDSSLFSTPAHQALRLAERKIADLLGNLDVDFIVSHCRFGPGSDSSTRGDNTTAYHKYGSRGSVTPWVLSTYAELFGDRVREPIRFDDRSISYARVSPKGIEKSLGSGRGVADERESTDGSYVEDFVNESDLVRGNKLSFVPKNAKIDRAICTEPRWNIFLQLGIGDLIAQRLLLAGIDLQDQEPNREAASRAQRDGLATIDLSSASDTVSKNLVLALLPEDWSDLIFKSRSPSTLYKGQWIKLEKVSSMGNGYTFPLESLIFYAFAYAATQMCGGDTTQIKVFGDDIIVESKVYRTLVEVLNEVGFQVNPDKSFSSGNFYESCGTDYFKGKNVRPIFLKEKVSNVERAIRLANQIVEFARRVCCYRLADPRIMVAYQRCVRRIPKSHRLFGPIGINAGVIHAPFDVCCPKRAPHGWEGYSLKAFVPIPIKRDGFNARGHLYSKLSKGTGTGQAFITRNQVRWKRKIVYVPTYSDFFVT